MTKISLVGCELDPSRSAVVLGAPGSGKTQSLLQLVSSLEDSGFQAAEILVLTPSRLSANSLRDKIASPSKLAAERPRARSISSFAFELASGSHPDLKLFSGASQQALIAELVAKAIKENRHKIWGLDKTTVQLQGFQTEVRDLIAVVIENQLEPQQMQAIQQQFPGTKIQVAIDLLPQYLNVLKSNNAMDPSELLIAACEQIESYEPPKFLVVDDAQDLSPAAMRLVELLSARTVTFLFGDPDAAVLGFRSGAESFVSRFSSIEQRLNLLPESVNEQKTALLAKVCSRIPTSLAVQHRPKASGGAIPPAKVFDNQSAEADWLAATLRRAKLIDQVPWDQMAVVARTRTQLDQLAADLVARSVPVRITGVQKALREQPSARAVLDFGALIYEVADDIDREQLLFSSIVGLDSLGVRRLFRELSQSTEHQGESRSQIARSLFEDLVDSDTFEIKKLNRVSEQLRKIRNLGEISAYQFVSLVSELIATERLQTLSRGRSAVALAANRELDGMLELFAAASRFDLREQGTASEFVSHQLELAIPEDSLAPIGLRPSVTLATSAQLAGASFEIVAIPRLQEGIWPNLKPRNSLLGAANLQSYLLGRTASPETASGSELADELRLFYKAVGTHRSKLLLSAMSSQDEQPSQFFTMFGIELDKTEVDVDFDIRRKVGRLRKQAMAKDQSAIATLAALSLAGVPGAHPRNWHGNLEISSLEPVITSEEQLRLSASRLEAFEKCPLHWFIGAFGADAKNFQASIGTLLHAALEASATGISMESYVESNWHTLEFESQWQALAQRRRGAKMLAMISQYLNHSNELVQPEQGFEVAFGNLVVAGKIDRVEKDGDGLWVVDLKTGKPPTQKEVLANRQLALYQLALSSSGESVSGAKIVSVGGDSLKVLEQPSLNAEHRSELEALLERASNEIGSDQFQASISSHCEGDGNCQLLIAKAVQFA